MCMQTVCHVFYRVINEQFLCQTDESAKNIYTNLMIGSNLTKCNIGKNNSFCGEGRVIRIYNYGISATERMCVPKGPVKQ